jgi:hypothetical protein
MRRTLFRAFVVTMMVVVGFILLILYLDSIWVIGWSVIPFHKMHAEQFLQDIVRSDFKEASVSLAREKNKRRNWIGQMEELKEQGFYPIRFENLKVPYDASGSLIPGSNVGYCSRMWEGTTICLNIYSRSLCDAAQRN